MNQIFISNMVGNHQTSIEINGWPWGSRFDWLTKTQKKTCHPWKVTSCLPRNHPFAKENHLNQTTIVFKMWTFQGVKCTIDSLRTENPWKFRAATRFELNAKTLKFPFFKNVLGTDPEIFEINVEKNFFDIHTSPNGLAARVYGCFGLETSGALEPDRPAKTHGEILMENAGSPWQLKGWRCCQVLVKDTSQGLAAWGSLASENWTTATEIISGS